MSHVNGSLSESKGARKSTSSSSGAGSVFDDCANSTKSLSSLHLIEREDSKEDHNRAECIAKKLKKCGYSDALCRQAIACTAVTDHQTAARWLINHVDDPWYGLDSPLDVSVQLVPSGGLASIVEEFWENVRKSYGWRPVHNILPRIILVKRFKIYCSQILNLYSAFDNTFKYFAERGFLDNIPLDFLCETSPTTQFFGFMVLQQNIVTALDDMVNQFLKRCYEYNVHFDVSRTVPYHMSLESLFPPSMHALLESLRQQLPIGENGRLNYQDTRWELRLFTSDPRTGEGTSGRDSEEAYRMCGEWMDTQAVDSGRMEYTVNDVVCMRGPAAHYKHGLADGFNCSTGTCGLFPLASAERTPVWTSWSLHRCLCMSSSAPSSPDSGGSRMSLSGELGQGPNSIAGSLPSPKPPSEASSRGVLSGGLSGLFGGYGGRQPRQMHIMRHGERADFALGLEWIAQSFDHKGVYKRTNLNLPTTLPARPYEEFAQDPPLTLIGQTVAAETGRALKEQGVRYSCCYASPALRCVQTAAEVLRAAGQSDLPIRVEPFLFEWLGYYRTHQPNFMGAIQLHQAGYPVDTVYKPYHSDREFDFQETQPKYYERKYKITKKICDATKKKGGNILIVAHRGSLEACSRQFVGKSCTWSAKSYIPYCALLAIEERRGGKWSMIEPPVPTFVHDNNSIYDWRQHLQI